MDFTRIVTSLSRFGRVLPAIVADLPTADVRWKPSEGDWSILEIVCHLGDEEVEDFRARVRLALEAPDAPWPTFDPKQLAIDRRYIEQDFSESLERFLRERSTSLEWLDSLEHPTWQQAHHSPTREPLSAGEIMASWAAHDLLHLRQISRRLYQLTSRDAGEFAVGYAGVW